MLRAALPLSLFCVLLASCSSSDSGLACGPGTHEENGQCVPHTGGVDAGADDDDAGAAADAAATGGDKRVFVTRTTYNGDLGGLAGADDKCQTAAEAFSLGGTWVAWLSDSSNSALARVTATGPWKDLSGESVFTNRAMLETLPLVNIAVHESGERAQSSDVWTGTSTGGEASTSHCDNWSRSNLLSGGLHGEFETSGDTNVNDGTTDNWTSRFLSDCDEAKRLYCFEQ